MVSVISLIIEYQGLLGYPMWLQGICYATDSGLLIT